MKEPLEQYMRVGILQAAAFPNAQLMDALKQLLELHLFRFIEVPPVCDASIRALMAQHGVQVEVDAGATLHASRASLCSTDAAERACALSIVRQAIDAAGALGACRVSIISGRDPGPPRRADAFARLTDSIFELYDNAHSLDLSLKMADRAIDKHFLIGPTREGVAVAREIQQKHSGFGVILNLGHLPLLDEDPTLAAEIAAPYLARVDIGNCILSLGDTHPRIGVRGGAIETPELAAFLRALLRAGYLEKGSPRVIAFEVRPTPDEDPIGVIRQSYASLCAAWIET